MQIQLNADDALKSLCHISTYYVIIHIQLANRTTIADHAQHSWGIVTVSRDLALSFLFCFHSTLIAVCWCCCWFCFHDFWNKQNVNSTYPMCMGQHRKWGDKMKEGITGGEHCWCYCRCQYIEPDTQTHALARSLTRSQAHCNHRRFAMTTWIKSNGHGQKNKIIKNVSTSRIGRCIQFMTMCC